MGGCFSYRQKVELQNVRVVHLNGYVEDFEQPISVGQVTGKPTKHFVCTPAQLLSSGSKPLKHDTVLQPGQVYFLLPYSALQSDVSPLDLASIARKLTSAAAKSSRKQSTSAPQSPVAYSSSMSGQFCPSPVWSSLSSPGRSPGMAYSSSMSGQFCPSPVWSSMSSPGRSPGRSPLRFVEQENLSMMMDYDSQRSSRGRSWKPLLDTITERSLNKRTESDLQEMHVEVVVK